MMTAKVTGSDRLKARMRQLPDAIQNEMRAGVIASAEELASLQRQLAPVDDGDLRDSIHVTRPLEATPAYSQPGGGGKVMGPLQAMVTAGNSKVRYAHLVEFGAAPHTNAGMFPGTQHPGTAAQPYFWPAYRLLKKKMVSRIKRGITKALKRNAGLVK